MLLVGDVRGLSCRMAVLVGREHPAVVALLPLTAVWNSAHLIACTGCYVFLQEVDSHDGQLLHGQASTQIHGDDERAASVA